MLASAHHYDHNSGTIYEVEAEMCRTPKNSEIRGTAGPVVRGGAKRLIVEWHRQENAQRCPRHVKEVAKVTRN